MWTLARNGEYITEMNCRPAEGFRCPKCRQLVLRKQIVKMDMDASCEDVYGWHFKHGCGARLLVIND